MSVIINEICQSGCSVRSEDTFAWSVIRFRQINRVRDIALCPRPINYLITLLGPIRIWIR